MIVSNHWSEFDNFLQTADQMLTEILQMEDKYQFPNFPFIFLCHSTVKTRQISHLHGSALFTNAYKFDKMLTFFLIQNSFLSVLLIAWDIHL